VSRIRKIGICRVLCSSSAWSSSRRKLRNRVFQGT
jgi:hypothetical protein